MPVAKSAANQRKQSARRADHQAIKDLVRDLPSLIMQNSDTGVPIDQPPTTGRPIVVHSDPKQRRWVWLGVIFCTLIIGAFWIFNIRSLIERTFDGRSIEQDIANSAGQDLQALLNTVMINNEKLKQTPSSTARLNTTSTAPSEEALRAALIANLNSVTTTAATTTN